MLAPNHAEILDLLREGDIKIVGRLIDSSNSALVIEVSSDELSAVAVYKPREGERPLWDFAAGTLHLREVAAYRVGVALGWDLVPPTILRQDAPYGGGSVQLWIDHDPDEHAFVSFKEDPAPFRRIVLFDAVINNADRKAGHVLKQKETDRLWCIDHGVCFHEEEKLRTVLWPFAGEALSQDEIDDLARLDAKLDSIKDLVSAEELLQTRRRLRILLEARVFPDEPNDRHAIPWPPI